MKLPNGDVIENVPDVKLIIHGIDVIPYIKNNEGIISVEILNSKYQYMLLGIMEVKLDGYIDMKYLMT